MARVLLFFAAVAALAQTAEESAWTLLKEGVENTDSDKRQQAITAIALAGAMPRAVELVERRLNDAQPEVRQTAASVLGQMKAVHAIPKLREALDDNEASVAIAAAKALADLRDDSGLGVLEDVLAGRPIRKSKGFIKSEIDSQIKDAKKELKHPGGLALMGLREASGMFLPFGIPFGAIRELTKDGGVLARTVAVNALAEDTKPATIDPLERALADKNWVVRAAAIRALVQRRAKEAIPAIQASFADSNDQVRWLAAAAVVRLSEGASPTP